MSILLLPSEIIDIICTYLSGSDYCNCLCVSSTWYNTFIHHLYRNLTIHGEQHLEQVCRNLLQHAPIYLGNSVRTVNLRIESISNRHLSQLGAWCVFVESLSLRWSIWHEDELQQQQQTPQDGDHSTNRNEQFPSIMASFIGPFMNLSRLSLDVSFGKQEITLPDFIPFLPRLTSLTLANGTHLSLEYIEYIHKMCPVLQHLSLQGTFIGRIPSIIAAAGTTTNAETTTSNLDRSDIKPATSLLQINLEFVIGGHDYYLDWFSYFGIKYPNLVSFEFRQYGLPISPATSAVIGPQRQINSSLYDHVFTQLATGCPKLTQVHLYNIHLHSGFFEKLSQTLQRVSLHLPLFPTTSYLSNLFDHRGLQQHLTCLDLSIPMKKDNSTDNHQLAADDLVAVLGQLYCLVSLTLRGGSEVTCIHLDTLLQSFTRLTQLTLVGLKLGLQQLPINNDISSEYGLDNITNTSPFVSTEGLYYYPLESLTLRGVSMMDPWLLFPWIDKHVKLSYLNLAQSCRSISTTTNRMVPSTIWLPQTRLMKFVTSERRLQNNPIRLYMLQQTSNTINKQPNATDYWPRFTDLEMNNHAINGSKHSWHILKFFDHEMLAPSQLEPLKTDRNFEWVVTYHSIRNTCPWYAEFCDAAEDVYKKQQLDKNKVDDIDGVEYVKIVCQSIEYLKINDCQLAFVG